VLQAIWMLIVESPRRFSHRTPLTRTPTGCPESMATLRRVCETLVFVAAQKEVRNLFKMELSDGTAAS
jgi:hypothetical protein